AFQGELDTECWQSDVARVRHRGNGGLRASANPKDRRRLMLNLAVEAPKWLNPGDTSWQMTAATLVGLMSVPGLAVLYGGVMQKRWSVNSMILTFATFSVVLIVWVIWGFKMGFGVPWHGLSDSGFFGNFIGKPGPVLSHSELQSQGNIPLLGTQAF